MAEYNCCKPNQNNNFASIPPDKPEGDRRQYKQRFFCLLCELQIPDETMVEDVRVRPSVLKYPPGGGQEYFPFLEQISKRASSTLMTTTSSDYVTLCSYCSCILRAQWAIYEQQPGKLVPPEKRTYQPHIFICGVCGVQTYRRRVRALPTDEFPFLFSRRKPGSVCLTQHTAPHTKVQVVVCLDCFETLSLQKADYDRMGVPLLQRGYSWVSRTDSPTRVQNIPVAASSRRYDKGPTGSSVHTLSQSSKSFRPQRVSVSGFPGQAFYPTTSHSVTNTNTPPGSYQPSRRCSVSQIPCSSSKYSSEVPQSSLNLLRSEFTPGIHSRLHYPTPPSTSSFRDSTSLDRLQPHRSILNEQSPASNTFSKSSTLQPPIIEGTPSLYNSHCDLLPQQFELNNNNHHTGREGVTYSLFYFHQLYLQLKRETQGNEYTNSHCYQKDFGASANPCQTPSLELSHLSRNSKSYPSSNYYWPCPEHPHYSHPVNNSDQGKLKNTEDMETNYTKDGL